MLNAEKLIKEFPTKGWKNINLFDELLLSQEDAPQSCNILI